MKPAELARLAGARAVHEARASAPMKPGVSPGPLDHLYARAAVSAAIHAAAPAIVHELYERVDGGWCRSCTLEACEALAAVFPDVPWAAVFERVEADR